jgi:hypothetical protein
MAPTEMAIEREVANSVQRSGTTMVLAPLALSWLGERGWRLARDRRISWLYLTFILSICFSRVERLQSPGV